MFDDKALNTNGLSNNRNTTKTLVLGDEMAGDLIAVFALKGGHCKWGSNQLKKGTTPQGAGLTRLTTVRFTVCTSRSDLEKTTIFQTATVLCMISSLIS